MDEWNGLLADWQWKWELEVGREMRGFYIALEGRRCEGNGGVVWRGWRASTGYYKRTLREVARTLYSDHT